jgi:hypothetical protein
VVVATSRRYQVTEERTSEVQQPIGDQPPVGAEPRTVEQVEAEYRARQAGKDRENEALRAELQRFKDAEARTRDEAESKRIAEQGEIESLKARLTESEQTRALEARRYRYPNASDALDPSALMAMDEAKLQGLEARLTVKGAAAPAPYVDPNTPPRNPTAPQPTGPKSSDELKADLERYAPDYQSYLATRRG